MKTFSAKAHEIKHDWYVVDAQDKVLGRLAATQRGHARRSATIASLRLSVP